MKIRIVDKLAIKGKRHETDETWDHFANCLISAFSEKKLPVDFFEKAYTSQRVRKFDEKFFDSIIYNVPPAFLPAKDLFAEGSKLHAYPEMKNILMSSKGSDEAPVFVLGYVGTGKTTFLRYAFGLRNKLEKECDVAASIVDLKVAPTTTDRILLYIINEINNSINANYPCIAEIDRATLSMLFSIEIEQLTKTIQNKDVIEQQKDEFFKKFPFCIAQGDFDNIKLLVKKKIEYLKNEKNIKQFWIILDNIDQHYYCLHHRALLSSVSLSNDLSCQMVITMRYITLNSPEAREVYTAYFPRKLNLSLPDVGDLLRKRFDIFKTIVKDFENIDLKITAYQYKISHLVEDLKTVLSTLVQSDVLTKFLLPLSNYNIRRLLQILLNCLQSYYFFFDYFNNDRYLPNKGILFKRILFAHCLKNQDYFDPTSDDEELFIINLFENENKTAAYNQTIRIRMLQGLISFGQKIELQEYTRILTETFSYGKVDILRALRVFLKAQLFAIKGVIDEDFNEGIFLAGLKEEDLDSKDISISVTYAGIVHYDLLFILEYLEIMKFSTYVMEEDYVAIQEERYQKQFKDRIAGNRKFLQYLINEELQEKSIIKDHNNFKKYFGTISERLKKEIDRQIDVLTSRNVE